MIRSVLLVFFLSSSVFALSGFAYAQSTPDTRQTDQSEEDWRKSQKKGGTTTEDILDIFENKRGTGSGNGSGYSPIDALPEESRRHLMKERARRMAQAGPNEPVDVTFKPSEAAKSDSALEEDEKAAWEKMSHSMNGTPNSDQGQQGQPSQSGAQGQPQGNGQPSGGPVGEGSKTPSVIRGGSAMSVADIMSRIKGLGQSPQGQQGQSENPSQSPLPSQTGTNGQVQAPAQSDTKDPTQSQSQAKAQTTAEAQAEAADQAHSTAHSQEIAPEEQSKTAPEAISPLDRIKTANRERAASGSRSSASDYLKKND